MFVNFITKNIKSLLFPYLIYCFISILWVYFSHFISGGEFPDDYLIKSIYGVILGVGFNTEYTIFNNPPLWFLPAMFMLRIISGVVFNFSNYIKILLGGIMIVLVVLLHKNSLFLPFSLGASMLAFPFFYVGNLIKNLNILEIIKENKIFTFVLSVLIWYISIYCNTGMVDINCIEYQNMVFTFLGGISGSFMIFVICFKFENWYSSFVLHISNGTLLIMSLHLFCIAIVYKIFIELGGVLNVYLNTIGVGVVLSLIVVAMLYYPILFCEKHFPILLGKVRKG